METIDKKTAEKYEIAGGVMVKKIIAGGVLSKTRMEEGFIITSVNGYDITSIDELNKAIVSLRGESIYLEGIYTDADGVYRYPLKINVQ